MGGNGISDNGTGSRRSEETVSARWFVSMIGMLGSLGGGFWLASALSVLTSPQGGLLDLLTALFAAMITLAIAGMVQRHGGRLALVMYGVFFAFSAVLGPALAG